MTGSRELPFPPQPAWSGEPAQWWAGASWTFALCALAYGVVAAILGEAPLGLGVCVLGVTAVVIVVAVARPQAPAVGFFGAAAAFSVPVLLRSSSVLLALDVAAVLFLLALGAAFARAGRPERTGVRAYVARSVSPVMSLPGAITGVGAPFGRALGGTARARHVPRALAIVVPVVAVFVVLLASADAVFEHYLRIAVEIVPTTDRLPRILTLFVVGAIVMATLLRRASDPIDGSPSRELPWPDLRRSEWISLLSAVDAVFLAFVLVQATAFFGGRTHVLEQEGLTFAEYARTGFAQLLAASVLTSLLVAGVWFAGRVEGRRDGTVFAVLAGGLVVLTLVVLVSAFRRLVLYESAFGWTWPRLIGHATVVFLGLSLVAGLVWITIRRGAWLPTAVLMAGLAVLAGLNAIDPDRFIAERNLERYAATGDIDTWELAGLSADAAPTMAAALPDLRARDAARVRSHLACLRDELAATEGDLASWNLARSEALEVLEATHLGPCRAR